MNWISVTNVRIWVVLGLLLTACALQPIAGPTSVTGEQRSCGGPALDCRGYFSQAQREFKASISGLAPTGATGGLGVGAASSQLIGLDTLSGDMIVHYQRYCQQYNACLLSREEFVRRTDTLQGTQTAIRTMVGGVQAPQPPPAGPGLSLPTPGMPGSPSPGVGGGTGDLGQPGPAGTFPDGTTKPMRVADAAFKVILESMRPTPSTGAAPFSGPSTSFAPPRSGAAAGPEPGEPFRAVTAELAQILRGGGAQVPVKAVLGEINYRDTEFGSPASVFMKTRLQEELSASGAFALAEPVRLRNVGVAEKVKSGSALAEAAGTDYVITGNYWDNPEGVELFVSLRQRQGDVLLGVARAVLPAGTLPSDATVVPANLTGARLNERIEDQIAPLSTAQPMSPLKVEVWTDRGRGAIYAEGEEILVMVRTNEDAHVRLYYTDANNLTYQIFPNQYRRDARIQGGTVVTLPGQEDRFAFRVKAPFGVESVTALASRKPFGGPASGGVAAGPFQQVPEGLRGLETVATGNGGDIVRDRAVLTSVAKKR